MSSENPGRTTGAVSSDIAHLPLDHDLQGRNGDAGGRGPSAIGSAFERSSEIPVYIRILNKYYLSARHRLAARPALERLLISLRANGDLLNNFRLIWVIQPPEQKYSAFHPIQISGYFRAVPSLQEGRIARRHERGTGCGGRESAGAQM
jgi:hypothetical protein